MDRKTATRVLVHSLARVEGHGGIEVVIDNDKVSSVRVPVHEGPRLFERLVVGKTPEEDVNITARICAICTLSHRYAALRGLEKALGIRVPPKVRFLRDLMHYGEMIESHALHVFVLALPDFLGYPSAIAMLPDHGPVVAGALELKKFGNSVMELTSGRKTHGENPQIGGFGRFPTEDELRALTVRAAELLPFAEQGVELMRGLRYPNFMEEGMVFMALMPPGDDFGFVGDRVMISTGEVRDVEEYRDLTNERVVAHSFAKRSSYNRRPFTVGANARLNLLGERLDGKAGDCFRRCYTLSWIRNPLYNNLAQAIELVFCLERLPRLVDEILKHKEPPLARPVNQTGSATGAVEAPRGILYHHYDIEDGVVAGADIITPTAQNLDTIESHIRVGTEALLARGERGDMELKLEMIARAYDPCISCSVHVIDGIGTGRR